jgi:hypothetical protein
MQRPLARVLGLMAAAGLLAACASQRAELAGGKKTLDPAKCLRDDSLIYNLVGHEHPFAELTVKNISNRAVLATLEWDGGLGVQRQYNVVVYPSAEVDTRLTLDLQSTTALHMRVVEAKWK